MASLTSPAAIPVLVVQERQIHILGAVTVSLTEDVSILEAAVAIWLNMMPPRFSLFAINNIYSENKHEKEVVRLQITGSDLGSLVSRCSDILFVVGTIPIEEQHAHEEENVNMEKLVGYITSSLAAEEENHRKTPLPSYSWLNDKKLARRLDSLMYGYKEDDKVRKVIGFDKLLTNVCQVCKETQVHKKIPIHRCKIGKEKVDLNDRLKSLLEKKIDLIEGTSLHDYVKKQGLQNDQVVPRNPAFHFWFYGGQFLDS